MEPWMEPWQRCSFMLAGVVVAFAVVQKKRASVEQIEIYEWFICSINFITICYLLFIKADAFSLLILFSALFITFFIPLGWGHWMYTDMFESSKATFRISYRSFKMISFLGCSMVFSALLMVLLGLIPIM